MTRFKTRLIGCVALIALAGAAQAQQDAAVGSMMAAAHAGGMIAGGEMGADREFVLDDARSLTLIITSTANLLPSLQLPDGTSLTLDKGGNDKARWYAFSGNKAAQILMFPGVGSGFNTILQLSAPPAGGYVLQLRRRDASTVEAPFMVTRVEDSDLRMGLMMPSSDAMTGAPFVFGIVLFDGAEPVRGARVLAAVAQTTTDPAAPPIRSAELPLGDDGKGVDTAADDGLYTGMLVPQAEGKYWIAVRALGKNAAGLAYERDVGFSLVASKATVQIAKPGLGQWQRDTRAGKISQYSVPVAIRGPAGQYELVVTLNADNARQVHGSALLDIGAGGSARSVVNVGAAALHNLEADGPYALASIEAYELGATGRVLRGRWQGANNTPAVKLGNTGQQ